MATVCAKVLKHHLKADGTYNVKIRIFHKNEKRYIDTDHYVTDKQLSRNMTIKDPIINRKVNQQVDDYRITISNLGEKLEFFNAERLRDYLTTKNEDINFIRFCDDHIRQLKKDNRAGTAANHTTVRNSLVDYFKREKVSILEITAGMLKSYERFLRDNRTMTRVNQFDKEVTTKSAGLTDSGLYNYMRDLRTLFNAARDLYNDEDLGIIRIPHYPFKKYKVGTPPQTAKRNIPLKVVKAIGKCTVRPGGRAELARDLFMLSFYMCGTNAVDLYHCTDKNIINGRIEYNRSKTKGRRKDKAFISIKIVEEVKPLLEKYIGKLSLRYSTAKNLDAALSRGMRQISKLVGIPGITFYWARHTFSNSARNDCRVSKDDIALALNHIDNGHRTTDIYISRDWKIIDEVQRKVIVRLRNLDRKDKNRERKTVKLLAGVLSES